MIETTPAARFSSPTRIDAEQDACGDRLVHGRRIHGALPT